jgi:hypothetical protein
MRLTGIENNQITCRTFNTIKIALTRDISFRDEDDFQLLVPLN